jgi:hypothetical protein
MSMRYVYAPITYSMEQSHSWETNQFVDSQAILRVLLSPKVNYRILNCLPSVSILSQPNPVSPEHIVLKHPQRSFLPQC